MTVDVIKIDMLKCYFFYSFTSSTLFNVFFFNIFFLIFSEYILHFPPVTSKCGEQLIFISFNINVSWVLTHMDNSLEFPTMYIYVEKPF